MGFIKQLRLSIINPFSIPQKNKQFFIYVQKCKEIIPNSRTISLVLFLNLKKSVLKFERFLSTLD